MWKVSYIYQGNRISFNDDHDIGTPSYTPECDTADSAVRMVIEYMIELYNCNCLNAEFKAGKLTITEPSDGEFICEYSDFSAIKC